MKNLVNFGKHNGKDWSEVPEDYINWVCKNSKVDWQRSAAQQELDRRNGSVPNRPNRASGGMSEVALDALCNKLKSDIDKYALNAKDLGFKRLIKDKVPIIIGDFDA